ncbi:type II toxin-antitoxin system RelE/ParE family toxin [Rhodoferax sp. AJA081-3]|uniref:type II toxin-antitoxin system RelE/ParE family toxin n=1 Tax=Rhodoferax sp. AJA081-3 TaxID=2752316 RepID=UPI001ADF0245|nr:type II toxin-antitoxin system RelE/ParE family toxin [Rhodoferax sp. AJA081-3]QTN28214.1 type II toxin-antitoxin system RelE/ParE family toxin [Rhodoferax sp. AJA081-3]
MSIRLLEPAQAELDEAIAWYADQAPGLGDAFLIETLKTFKLIDQFPTAWHPLTRQIRRCRLKRFPYSVVYTQDGMDVLVLAIAHQHRKPNYWGGRLR